MRGEKVWERNIIPQSSNASLFLRQGVAGTPQSFKSHVTEVQSHPAEPTLSNLFFAEGALSPDHNLAQAAGWSLGVPCRVHRWQPLPHVGGVPVDDSQVEARVEHLVTVTSELMDDDVLRLVAILLVGDTIEKGHRHRWPQHKGVMGPTVVCNERRGLHQRVIHFMSCESEC